MNGDGRKGVWSGVVKKERGKHTEVIMMGGMKRPKQDGNQGWSAKFVVTVGEINNKIANGYAVMDATVADGEKAENKYNLRVY